MAEPAPASNADWFERARRVIPGRGGLARPLLRLRRRDAVHGCLGRGRVRASTPRGTATSTWCSPTARCCSGMRTRWSPGPSRPRRPSGTTFGAPTPGEVLLAEAICARVPGLRAGAPRLLGDRGGHERGASGPRRHRARPGDQVRRLLPRPLRRLAGRRGQRRGHARPAGLGRRVRRRRGRHRGRSLQRGPRARRASGLRDRRARGGQHEPGGAGARVSSRGCAPRAAPAAPC